MGDYGFVIEPGTDREEFVSGGTERAKQVIAALHPTAIAERTRHKPCHCEHCERGATVRVCVECGMDWPCFPD